MKTKESYSKALIKARRLKRIPFCLEMKKLGIPSHFWFLIRKQLIEKGFANLKKRRSLSDKELLNELKRVGKIVKRTPTGNAVKKYSFYNLKTFINHFGSMRNAQKLAGFKPNKLGKSNTLSKQILINEMKRIAGRIKKTPSQRDILRHGRYHPQSFQKYFGSLPNAQKEAGLVPNK